MNEATEFWGFVARERAALEQTRKHTLGDVVAWLEKERKRAEDLRFSYAIRSESLRVAYEEGRLDVINEVLQKLKGVRA